MPSPSNYNAAGQIQISGGTSPYIDESKTNTTITRDPFQEFLFSLLGAQAQNEQAYVPEYTQEALANFTANPATAAAQYFPSLAAPLVSALRPQFDQEQSDLKSLFRSAGGTEDTPLQSGAFAQSARQLINDQGNRTQQLLAQNYVPLTNQISGNINNAINAGLNFPQANTAVLRSLAPLAGSISPLSTQVEAIKGGSNAQTGGNYAAGTNNNYLAAPFFNPANPYV